MIEDYQKSFAIDRPRNMRLWTWDDASKIANFRAMHRLRCDKFGVDIGIEKKEMTKEEMKQKEDDLTAYFLHEMRKQPVSA